MVTSVSFQFRYSRTQSASRAVTIDPVSCTSPVPTRFRMPSASVMMREIRMPLFVESKYRIGRRITCASTSLRISVMARCAATPSTWELVNAVSASTVVARPAASASFGSRSQLPLLITSSIRYFVVVGSTRPDSRLISISTRPSASRLRWIQISARASSHAPAENAGFFG